MTEHFRKILIAVIFGTLVVAGYWILAKAVEVHFLSGL
jgi:hypothetical protein